jgi:hypothetical protein
MVNILFNGKAATAGNGTMAAIWASTAELINPGDSISITTTKLTTEAD